MSYLQEKKNAPAVQMMLKKAPAAQKKEKQKKENKQVQKKAPIRDTSSLFKAPPAQAKTKGGNGGVNKSTTSGKTDEKGKKPGGSPKNIKMTIAADKEAKFMSKRYINDAAVGHSWIMLETADGKDDSYGFWPANLGAGGGFDPSKPWKSVAGEVRQPDTAHTPNAKLSVQIDEEELKNGEKYAADNASKDYNLLTYNCTTFAREFFKKSSGKTAPSGGMLIDNPNGLYDSIENRNGVMGRDAMENQKPPKKTNN